MTNKIQGKSVVGPSILPTRESLAHQLMVALRGRHFTIIEVGPVVYSMSNATVFRISSI